MTKDTRPIDTALTWNKSPTSPTALAASQKQTVVKLDYRISQTSK